MCTQAPHIRSYDTGHAGNTSGPSVDRKDQLSEQLLSGAEAECRVLHSQGHPLTTAGSHVATDGVSKLRGHCAPAPSSPRSWGYESFSEKNLLKKPALATDQESLACYIPCFRAG